MTKVFFAFLFIRFIHKKKARKKNSKNVKELIKNLRKSTFFLGILSTLKTIRKRTKQEIAIIQSPFSALTFWKKIIKRMMGIRSMYFAIYETRFSIVWNLFQI